MSAQPTAVMLDAADLLRRDGYKAIPHDLGEACAAVCELIAAVDDVYGNPSGEPCKVPCPTCRIRAALARCQPIPDHLPSDMGTPTIGEES